MSKTSYKIYVTVFSSLFLLSTLSSHQALAKSKWKKVLGTGAAIIGGALLLDQLGKQNKKSKSRSRSKYKKGRNSRRVPKSRRAQSVAPDISRQENIHIQNALNEKGFDAGRADGVLGRQSRQAIMFYQDSISHPATGRLTDEEQNLLFGQQMTEQPVIADRMQPKPADRLRPELIYIQELVIYAQIKSLNKNLDTQTLAKDDASLVANLVADLEGKRTNLKTLDPQSSDSLNALKEILAQLDSLDKNLLPYKAQEKQLISRYFNGLAKLQKPDAPWTNEFRKSAYAFNISANRDGLGSAFDTFNVSYANMGVAHVYFLKTDPSYRKSTLAITKR